MICVLCVCVYIYIYTYNYSYMIICPFRHAVKSTSKFMLVAQLYILVKYKSHTCDDTKRYHECMPTHLRPVHLFRVFLLRVLESNFPGDPLSKSTDMIIPTP